MICLDLKDFPTKMEIPCMAEHRLHFRSAILAKKNTSPTKYLAACTACTFTFNSSTIFLINCYFRPSESEHILSPSVITELFNVFATTKHDAVIMTGDFNYCDIDSRDLSYQNETQKLLLNFAEKLVSIEKYPLTQLSLVYTLYCSFQGKLKYRIYA